MPVPVASSDLHSVPTRTSSRPRNVTSSFTISFKLDVLATSCPSELVCDVMEVGKTNETVKASFKAWKAMSSGLTFLKSTVQILFQVF